MNKYFYTDGIEKYGPFTKEELSNQKIYRETKIWCYGMDKWTELSKVPELINIKKNLPPELPQEETFLMPKFKTQSNQNKEAKAQQSKERKKNSSFSKWLFAIIVVIIISLFVYRVIQNQLEVKQYNEIVANSYDSDEDFDIYVQKFYRDLEIYGIYPKKPRVQIIKLSKLDQMDNTTHVHGFSYGMDNDDRIEIYINPSTWLKFNKPMRYFLMYHELAHDVLNLDDLEPQSWNKEKLMYPEMSSYEKMNMDDFIETYKALFEEQSE